MPNTSIYGLPVSCTSISFTLPLFRTVTGHDYLYPAVATARVISVPIPPSAPVMIASFMFTKYKLPIIRKIQSPFASISLSPFQAGRQFFLQMLMASHFYGIHPGYAVITMPTAATGILLLAHTVHKARFVEQGACHLYSLKPLSSTSSILARDTSPPTYINGIFSSARNFRASSRK